MVDFGVVVGSGVVGFGVVGFDVVVVVGVVGSGVVVPGVVGFGVIDDLQTSIPSAQVCSNFGSPTGPHFPFHDPPLPQQVITFLFRPHLEHSENQRTFLLSMLTCMSYVPIKFTDIIIIGDKTSCQKHFWCAAVRANENHLLTLIQLSLPLLLTILSIAIHGQGK